MPTSKKHHGKFKQDNRTFNFQMKPYFPKEVSKEFLLVNFVNNVNKLAEAQDVMLERVSRLAANMDSSPLKKDTLLERISLILSKLRIFRAVMQCNCIASRLMISVG